MSKILLFDEEAKSKLLKGVQVLSDAVSATLGPLGSNVALDKKWGAPSIVHDGVSVAKEIDLDDPFENMGAQLVKEAASKTNDIAGDGTTTATIIARYIVEYGFEAMKSPLIGGTGINPMVLRKGILYASNYAVNKLKMFSVAIKDVDDLVRVCKISAQDEQIGRIAGETVWKMGKDGVVTVDEGSGTEISVKVTEGMEFDRGYISPYFVTDSEKMEAEIKETYILITDKRISSTNEILPFLEKLLKVTKDLVIIADDVDGEALTMLVANKIRGTLNVLAIKAPGFGDRRREILEDISILTGGTLISEGKSLKEIEISDLGRAKKVWSDKDTTKIVGGMGEKTLIKKRIESLTILREKCTSEFDKEKLQERLAKLSSGVAVIELGAKTEVELREKKERMIDAVSAAKAALEDGIISGGASLTLRLSKELETLETDRYLKAGIEVFAKALAQPFRILVENAGLNYDESALRVIKTDLGIDVTDGEIKDMFKAGIVDPTRVTLSAIENASSVGSTILTTKVLVTDKKSGKK